ncbi:hypothetical protein pb186bvf_008705 [Paramecium bursaria]
MEFDILNDLLSDTVSRLFSPKPLFKDIRRPQIQPVVDNLIDTRQIRSATSSTSISQQASFQEPRTVSLDQWIQNFGPQKLAESLQRLNIDLTRLTKRDLESMNMDQLQNEKKRVKNELKSYDAQFQGIFNRFPLRQEKEPMRPLYIYYKKLKQYIDKAPQIPARTIQTNTEIQKRIDDLKKKRAELREILNTFQNDFTQNHNRKIRFHRDIAPVEREYKQYKDIKLEIQRLEQMIKK